jgi:protein-S-isoprenylcysteine O-methyltransferase Ste14
MKNPFHNQKKHFRENIDLSYIPKNTPEITLTQIWKHYFSSLFLYAIGLLMIAQHTWYTNLLNSEVYGVGVFEFFVYLFFAYAVLAPLVYAFTEPKDLWRSKPVMITNYLWRSIRRQKKNDSFAPSREERQAILFYFIKLFFGPQMVQYTFANMNSLDTLFLPVYQSAEVIFSDLENATRGMWFHFQNQLYFFLIPFLFFLDVFFFALGYIWEAPFLKNKLRSVDDSVLGIVVCLICYVPFNNVTGTFLGWAPNENVSFMNDEFSMWTWIFRWIGIFFLLLYALASVALFTRASNLTNRGIVSHFPYNIVRHPAYAAKNLHWWITAIPFVITILLVQETWFWEVTGLLLSLIAWSFIYYLRAYTEERHLSQDPDYLEYKEKVKYKFIPKIW